MVYIMNSETVIFGPPILHKMRGRTTKVPQNVLILARTCLLLYIYIYLRKYHNLPLTTTVSR